MKAKSQSVKAVERTQEKSLRMTMMTTDDDDDDGQKAMT